MSLRLLLLLAILSLASCSITEEPPQKRPAADKHQLKVIENSIGMRLVLIPPGEFMMGRGETTEQLKKTFPQYGRSRDGHDRLELADEVPQHKVRITRPFYLG